MKRILITFVISLPFVTGCRSDKNDKFILDPPAENVFQYSTLRVMSNIWEDNTVTDSIKFDFDLEKVSARDSISTFKLTYRDFTWKRPALRITINNGDFNETNEMVHAINVIDSMGFFLKGESIEVIMNQSGKVLDVRGIDELLDRVAMAARLEKRFLKMSIADHISVAAVTDFLSILFSPVPGKKVQEAEKWYPAVTLISKAPIRISNIFQLDNISGDTALIKIRALVSAQQSQGGNVYLKGEQTGIAKLSFTTGMPYLYETKTESIYTTGANSYRKSEYLFLQKK